VSPAVVPGKRPAISLVEIAKIAAQYGAEHEVCLIGLRGYYKDTMGEPGKNDRGIYDDCIAVYTPSRLVTFNANTDPGVYKRGIATLMPGVWAYRLGIHGLDKPPEKRYRALVQALPVNVMRDDYESFQHGYFGINIHKGGYSSVSSIGCQTIYPSQWPEFIDLVSREMKASGQERVNYILKEAQ
jgi:hypothetical protein